MIGYRLAQALSIAIPGRPVGCGPGRSRPDPWPRRWQPSARFTKTTGRPAAIGRLDDAAALLDGTAGTIVTP